MPAAMTAGGQVYYFGYDQVGSLRVVTNASGTVVKRIDYDSFGNILSDSNPTFAIPFGFAGGLHDRDTGLVRFGARDYDPATGKWCAKDPIDFAGGDLNLLSYVGQDPVNWVDINGQGSLLLGGGFAFIPLGGFEGSAGIAIGSTKDPCYKIKGGSFGSFGQGGGWSIGADLFVGWFRGDVEDISGETMNYNIAVGPLSGVLMFDPKKPNWWLPVGFTVGPGKNLLPGLKLAGKEWQSSVTKSWTTFEEWKESQFDYGNMPTL